MAIDTLGAALRQLNRLFAKGVVAGLSDAQLLERFLTLGDAGAFEALGGLVVCGADVTGRGPGPTVAFVEALSPLLMMTAVATAPIATTVPMNAATGRQRGSFGQASSP